MLVVLLVLRRGEGLLQRILRVVVGFLPLLGGLGRSRVLWVVDVPVACSSCVKIKPVVLVGSEAS